MLAADGKSATVTREVDAGVEEKKVRLPAVLTVDLRIIGKKAVRNEALAPAEAEWEESQRYASLKGIMAAKKKEIKEVTADSSGRRAATAAWSSTTEFTAPAPARPARRSASVEELVAEAQERSEGAVMGAVVVLLETAGQGIRSTSLHAITAARELAKHHGGPVVGVVIGAGAELAAAATDGARYVDKLLKARQRRPGASRWPRPGPRCWPAAVKQAGATALVGVRHLDRQGRAAPGGRPAGARAWPATSPACWAPRPSRRPTYAGNAVAEAEVGTDVVVVTVRQTEFPAAAARRQPRAPSRPANVGGRGRPGRRVRRPARDQERPPGSDRGQGGGLGRPGHEGGARTSRSWRS